MIGLKQVRTPLGMRLPQTNQEEDQVHKIKTYLSSLLQIAKLKSIEDIYTDSGLFYLFHSICVKDVIFRTKWKKGICRESIPMSQMKLLRF